MDSTVFHHVFEAIAELIGGLYKKQVTRPITKITKTQIADQLQSHGLLAKSIKLDTNHNLALFDGELVPAARVRATLYEKLFWAYHVKFDDANNDTHENIAYVEYIKKEKKIGSEVKWKLPLAKFSSPSSKEQVIAELSAEIERLRAQLSQYERLDTITK